MPKFKIPKGLPCEKCKLIANCIENGRIDEYYHFLENFDASIPSFLSMKASCENFDPDNMTVEEIFNTFAPWQKKVAYYLIGKAMSDGWKSTFDHINRSLDDRRDTGRDD